MSRSPSKARSLPALRPDQTSLPAAMRGRPTALQVSQLRSSYRAPHGFQLKDEAEIQSPSKLPSIGINSHRFPFPAVTKHKEASTGDEVCAARPSKAPRLLPRPSEDEFGILPSSEVPGKATSASALATSQPFFSLTDQELKQLRRSGFQRHHYCTIAGPTWSWLEWLPPSRGQGSARQYDRRVLAQLQS